MLNFYHCTSDIFLESIKKNGLGKINPNFDLKLLELLKFVYKFSKKNIPNNESLNKLDFTTNLMINQEIKYVEESKYKTDVLNFKHNGLFVTLGDLAAITHSHYNKFGSEVLNRIMEILNILYEQNVKIEIPKEIDNFKVQNLLNIEPKPIFIKIKNLDYDYLFNKYDIRMGIALKEIENKLKTTEPKVAFHFKQTTVFKYVKEIPINDYELFYLEYDGHPIDKDFEYHLTLIK